jgi:hypothetical protein
METNLMNNISNLRASEGDVLKSTIKVAIMRGIKTCGLAIVESLDLVSIGVGAGLQTHVNTRKNIKSMLSLR